ncbi:MAG: chemotaxis protein CheD [Bacteroidales bacterium]
MENINTHFLYPAAIHISRSPCLINTILGSCVAVCLYDSIHRYGGMNHFMLPLWNGQGLASPKYGNIAIDRLLEKMISMGSVKSNIIAKVFGGGEVIDTKSTQFNIGERNIGIAIQLLEELRIPVRSSSLGGKLGRKISFNTETGGVSQKYIQRQVFQQELKR